LFILMGKQPETWSSYGCNRSKMNNSPSGVNTRTGNPVKPDRNTYTIRIINPYNDPYSVLKILKLIILSNILIYLMVYFP